MSEITKALLTGLGGTLLRFIVLGVVLAYFKPHFGPLIFLVIEIGWIAYALARLVRGLLNIRTPPAKSDLAFFASVAFVLAILYLRGTYFPSRR